MTKRSPSGHIVAATILASALLGFFAAVGLLEESGSSGPKTSMTITPTAAVTTIGNMVTVTIRVRAEAPVNAFTGIVRFNPDVLQVDRIDYNTSIADLWAEAPWYKNGEGSVHFAGGTTRRGGFTGDDTLLVIQFLAVKPGDGTVALDDALVLFHDGLGTPAPLSEPIDAIFTVHSADIVAPREAVDVMVRTTFARTDLTKDGKTDLADVSTFMVHLTTQNKDSDVNRDGAVSLVDLNLILSAL